MLRLRLGSRRYIRQPDRDHPYLRDRKLVGWDPTMSEQEIAEAAAGWWRVGPRADRERYALVVGEHAVRLVMAIDEWIVDETDGRRAFVGRVLSAGDPVYDRFIDQPDPIPTDSRNPVAYLDDDADLRACSCGCGTLVRGDWAPGHDLAAVHRIVASHFDGSILRFTTWCGDQGYPIPAPGPHATDVEMAR